MTLGGLPTRQIIFVRKWSQKIVGYTGVSKSPTWIEKEKKTTCEINITYNWVQMSNIPNLFPYTLGLSSVSQKTTLSKISTKGSKIKIQEMFLEKTF